MPTQDKLIPRQLKLARTTPPPPREVVLSGARLTWIEPQDTRYLTHYNVYVGSDAGTPRYRATAGQTGVALATGDAQFWVSAANDSMGTESPKVYVSGTASGGGGGSTFGLVTGLAASVAEGEVGDNLIRMTVTGTLPVDAALAGVTFITEIPQAGDAAPETPTMPGVILIEAPEWYAAGNGAAFSVSFDLPKPSRKEKWVVYALSFGSTGANSLTRLSQISPPLPANATPFATVSIGDALTVPGSGLGDVSITGTPVLTPTGYGTLTIDLRYVPPYLSGPVVAIGDFQGVRAYVEYADGSVKAVGEFPYLGNYQAAPPDNQGTVSLSIPMPTAQTIYVQLCSYSSSQQISFKPHASAPVIRWVAIVISSATIGGGKATQVSGFNVTVESRVGGGDNSGAQEKRFKYVFTPPADTKWQAVWIHRVACDATYTPLVGGESGYVAQESVSPAYSGWFGMPQTIEYWWFRAYSLNWYGELNTVSAPSVYLSITPTGEVVNAALSITAAMLADLAVEARALADAAVTTAKYAPLSITTAAIGLLAVQNANIVNLAVNKLSPVAGAATIEATGGLTFNGAGGNSLTINSGGIDITSGTNTASLTSTYFGVGAVHCTTLWVTDIGHAGLSMLVDGPLTFNYPQETRVSLLGPGAANLGKFLKSTTSGGFGDDATWGTVAWSDLTGTQPAPVAHAASHAAAGSDALTLTKAQISDYNAHPTPATDGTYANPTSISIVGGIITAIS